MLNNTQTMEAAPAPAKTGGMLGKLLKYEFRATARLYLPLYLVVLVFGLLGRFSIFGVPWHLTSGSNQGTIPWTSFSISPEATGFWGEVLATVVTLILVGYVMVVMGAFVVHFIITLQRFWKNLMGDEGYLMFTLPVSTDALLWSKAICAFAWSIATTLVVLLSVLVLCGHPVLFREFSALLKDIGPEERALIWRVVFGIFPLSSWVMMAAVMVVSGLQKLFFLYASMAIGHTVRNHKVMASVGGYLVISMVEGIVSGTITTALMPFIAKPLEDPALAAIESPFYSTADVLRFTEAFGKMFGGTLLLALVIGVVSAVAGYLLVRYLLRTQLNLE